MKKLFEQTGETITEVLVALAISSLGLMMLAGMISASTRMIQNSKARMATFYDNNVALEEQTEPTGAETASVTLGDASFGTVVLFKNDTFDKPIISYKLK